MTDSRSEDETDDIGDTRSTQEFIKGTEQGNYQRPNVIKDLETKPKENPVQFVSTKEDYNVPSKNEDSQQPLDDAQDYSENPEPGDETQTSPGSDRGIHKIDSKPETDSKDEENREPTNDAEDYSKNSEPEDETENSPSSDSGKDSRYENEANSKDDDSQEPKNDAQENSENSKPENEARESPGSESGILEKVTDSRDEDNQGPTSNAQEYSEDTEPEDETEESPGSDSGIHAKDSRNQSETVGKDEDNQGHTNNAQDYSEYPVPEDEAQESPFSDSGIYETDSEPEGEMDSKDEDNQGPMNSAQDYSMYPEPDDETQESPGSDTGIHEKDSRMESQTDGIDQTQSEKEFLEDKEHDGIQGQAVTRENLKSEEVVLSKENSGDQSKEKDKEGPMNDSDYYSKIQRHQNEMQDSPSSYSGRHDGNTEMYSISEHSSEESQSPVKNEIHRHDSHEDTDEHDRPKEIKSAESVLIPHESVKVADLLHISTEVKHLDTVVNRISGFVRKTLSDIHNNMHEMAKMVSAVHPIAPSTMSHMINVTMTKTEKAVRKLCLEPIQKSLSIPPWSAWNSWGKCSQTCGSGGYKLRHRQCQSKSHHQCIGNNFDLSHCVLAPCPATWQTWSQWSPCSATCDNGHQMRTRMCLTSSEKVQCNGTTSEIKDCFSHKCDNSERQKSKLLGHLHFKSKSGNKVKFHMKFATQDSSDSTQASSGYSWSAWSGWTSCKECQKGYRERKRLCVNSLKEPLDKTLCPGTDVEFGPCIGLVCNRGNAVYVSEGKSMEVKCAKPPELIPSRVSWITPMNQHITHLSSSKRIHMSGSSLRVADARYADQGVYRCVLLLNNNTIHIIKDTLVVDTCKTHRCQNGGICQTTLDPDFDGIMSYKCRCIGKYGGPFCEIGPLNANKFIWAIITLIIALVVVLALALFLLRRSLRRTNIDCPKEHQWKKKGKSQTTKKTKCLKTDNKPKPPERPEDKGDISNTSIVSNDGSFVEISEHDYVDFDGLNLSQEGKNPRRGYESGHTSGGYEGRFLKYPSPPHKHMSQKYQQKESDYMTMDTLPKNFIIHEHNPAGFYDEESAYQDMSSGKVENFYENLPSGERGETTYTPSSKSEQDYIETLKYKASLKQRRASVDKEALAQEALDIVAENLTRQCLVEIENESQNSNKVASTGLNSSQIGSDAPKIMKDKPRGKPVARDKNIADISTVQTESPTWHVENTKSPKRKIKSIKQTKSPPNQETAKLTKSPNTGVAASHHSDSHNNTSCEASDPKGNRPVVKPGRESPPGSQGFKQQLVTQTDARSPNISKDRKPVPKPRRASDDTARQLQIRPPVSPTHRQYAFPKTLTIKDEKQEAVLHKHFDTSFVTQQVSPSTSTPKKGDKIARMNIIMPSDIIQADENETSGTFGRKTHSSELMVVTSSKVLGKTEKGPVNLGRGNISSNNRQTSASELSSGSEVFSDSYYQSLSQVTEPTGGSKGSSFRSLDTSTPLQTMPDLDNTVSFPKLTISYQDEGLGQATGPATPANTEHWHPGRNESLFQGEITEGSLYLSDCNYTQNTPESSELSGSDCSYDQTSDVEGSLDCTES
ncbi:uncharacterized protein [Haliotis asinina]|uniref:uncharacterized protein n=1 Tax=Haliotis asinina TaxID=109174 RepID=UPI003531A42F